MPTFVQSNNIVALLGKYNASQYLHTAGVPRDVDVVDLTTFGKTSKVYEAALKDGTSSFDGWLYNDGTVDAFMDALFGTPDTPFSFGWEGMTRGNTVALGKGINKHYEQTGEVGGYMGVSGEMQASGGIASGKCLQTLGAVTSTTTGTATDNGAGTSTGWEANAHCTDIAGGNPIATVKIQHSTDNSSWADLATFTAFTQADAFHLTSAAATTTVNRYVRVVVTFTGTTTSCTFTVALARIRQA